MCIASLNEKTFRNALKILSTYFYSIAFDFAMHMAIVILF